MRIQSRLYTTERLFWSNRTDVIDRGEYTVIRSSERPGWYWGNFLLFEGPPGVEDFERWLHLFDRELGMNPAIEHRLFAWEQGRISDEAAAPFLEAGYELEEEVTLLARSVSPPPRLNESVDVRPLVSDEEFEQLIDLRVENSDPRFEREGIRRFMRWSVEEYRRMIAAGHGQWYGSFLDDRLVATLGLFRVGTSARFQEVGTAAEYRRQGICGTMVYRVSEEALRTWGVDTLVMCADEHYHAARIYESVGFRPEEWSAALVYYPERG